MNTRVVPALVALSFAACGTPHALAPYSDAEVDRAFDPVRGLRARCYDASFSKQQREPVVTDFELTVTAEGAVRSRPQYASVDDAELLECLRHGLDALRFPARGREWLRVHLEFGNVATLSPAKTANLH